MRLKIWQNINKICSNLFYLVHFSNQTICWNANQPWIFNLRVSASSVTKFKKQAINKWYIYKSCPFSARQRSKWTWWTRIRPKVESVFPHPTLVTKVVPQVPLSDCPPPLLYGPPTFIPLHLCNPLAMEEERVWGRPPAVPLRSPHCPASSPHCAHLPPPAPCQAGDRGFNAARTELMEHTDGAWKSDSKELSHHSH